LVKLLEFSTKKIARQEAQAEALKPTRRAILLAGGSPCLSGYECFTSFLSSLRGIEIHQSQSGSVHL